MRFMRLLLVPLLGLYAGTLFAVTEQSQYNRINLQAEASEEVNNNRMQVQLSAQAENKDPAVVAKQINTDMTWAVQFVQPHKNIKTSTGNYTIHTAYQKSVFQHWVGQQSLILESSDIEALSTLIGHLQTRLQMKTVQFIVSPELRKNSEDKLISDALSAFKARALLIQKNMSAKSYKLVNVSVNTTPAGYTPVMMTEMRTSSMMPSPAMKSGTTELKVTVSGTIELID